MLLVEDAMEFSLFRMRWGQRVVSFINIVFTYFICTYLYINAHFLYSMVIICFYFINVEFTLTASMFLGCLEETEKLAKESKKKKKSEIFFTLPRF